MYFTVHTDDDDDDDDDTDSLIFYNIRQADRGFAADSIYQYYFNCIITADSKFS